MLRNTPASISGTRDRSRRSDSGSARSASQRLQQRRELLLGEGLAQEIIHAGGQTAFAVSFHGVRRQRDDGHARAARVSARAGVISAVAVSPSMTGIWQSISTAS